MFGNKFQNVMRKYAANKLALGLAIAGAVAIAGLGGLGVSHLVKNQNAAMSHVAPAKTTPQSSQRADGPGLGGGYAQGHRLAGAFLLADGPGGSGY